jgi:hypothetical protein
MTLTPGWSLSQVDQRVGRRIFEKVDYMMRVSVDQDRAVTTPAAERELVDAELAWRRNWRLG